jgi:hypothetical protein
MRRACERPVPRSIQETLSVCHHAGAFGLVSRVVTAAGAHLPHPLDNVWQALQHAVAHNALPLRWLFPLHVLEEFVLEQCACCWSILRSLRFRIWFRKKQLGDHASPQSGFGLGTPEGAEVKTGAAGLCSALGHSVWRRASTLI